MFQLSTLCCSGSEWFAVKIQIDPINTNLVMEKSTLFVFPFFHVKKAEEAAVHCIRPDPNSCRRGMFLLFVDYEKRLVAESDCFPEIAYKYVYECTHLRISSIEKVAVSVQYSDIFLRRIFKRS